MSVNDDGAMVPVRAALDAENAELRAVLQELFTSGAAVTRSFAAAIEQLDAQFGVEARQEIKISGEVYDRFSAAMYRAADLLDKGETNSQVSGGE